MKVCAFVLRTVYGVWCSVPWCKKMREEGIEPPTAGSGIQRSATELFPPSITKRHTTRRHKQTHTTHTLQPQQQPRQQHTTRIAHPLPRTTDISPHPYAGILHITYHILHFTYCTEPNSSLFTLWSDRTNAWKTQNRLYWGGHDREWRREGSDMHYRPRVAASTSEDRHTIRLVCERVLWSE